MNFHATVCILLFVIRQRNFSFCWVSNHQPVATVLEKPKTSWPFEIQKTCGRFLTAPGVFGFFGTGFQTLLRVVRLPDYSPVAVHQERKSWEKGKAHKADYSEPQSNFEKHEKKSKDSGKPFETNKTKSKQNFWKCWDLNARITVKKRIWSNEDSQENAISKSYITGASGSIYIEEISLSIGSTKARLPTNSNQAQHEAVNARGQHELAGARNKSGKYRKSRQNVILFVKSKVGCLCNCRSKDSAMTSQTFHPSWKKVDRLECPKVKRRVCVWSGWRNHYSNIPPILFSRGVYMSLSDCTPCCN